jgi:hypothetical protein
MGLRCHRPHHPRLIRQFVPLRRFGLIQLHSHHHHRQLPLLNQKQSLIHHRQMIELSQKMQYRLRQ